MGKGKVIALIIMGVIFIYPFRIAFMEPGEHSNTLSIAMFLVTLFGSLLAIFLGNKGN